MGIFDEVKKRVTAYDAVSYYGIKINNKGMCCCPFHDDKNPSMKVDSRYHCFGCGADGDAIDFVSNYFGLPVIKAAKKINEDFNLGIAFRNFSGNDIKSEEHLRLEREQLIKREVERTFDIMRRDVINILSKYHRLLWYWRKEYGPSEGDADWHPFFVESLEKLEFINELLDDLIFGDREKQLEIMEIYGEEIKAIGERIKNFN